MMVEGEKQRQNATNLTAIANNGLQETKEDLQNVKVSTDNAFRERINEMRDHKVFGLSLVYKVKQRFFLRKEANIVQKIING